jgi:hypothetical protein
MTDKTPDAFLPCPLQRFTTLQMKNQNGEMIYTGRLIESEYNALLSAWNARATPHAEAAGVGGYLSGIDWDDICFRVAEKLYGHDEEKWSLPYADINVIRLVQEFIDQQIYERQTAPAEPEAEGDVEEKPHTTLGDIIEFVSENAADLVNKKVCPSDSRDKDLIAVRDALELQSFEIRPQLGLPIVVEGGGRFIHERDFISAKSKILAIVNRMIAQTDKTGVV